MDGVWHGAIGQPGIFTHQMAPFDDEGTIQLPGVLPFRRRIPGARSARQALDERGHQRALRLFEERQRLEEGSRQLEADAEEWESEIDEEDEEDEEDDGDEEDEEDEGDWEEEAEEEARRLAQHRADTNTMKHTRHGAAAHVAERAATDRAATSESVAGARGARAARGARGARRAKADAAAAAAVFGALGRESAEVAAEGIEEAVDTAGMAEAAGPATGTGAGTGSVDARATAWWRASGLADEWARLDAEGQTVRLRLGSALDLVAQSRDKLLGFRAKVSCGYVAIIHPNSDLISLAPHPSPSSPGVCNARGAGGSRSVRTSALSRSDGGARRNVRAPPHAARPRAHAACNPCQEGRAAAAVPQVSGRARLDHLTK